MVHEVLPVAVIGSGPVGLAAATRLLERGIAPLLLEADSRPGTAVSEWAQARALAPLIAPNLHSCGTVPAHDAAGLVQPEPGFFVAGMKSCGGAPPAGVAACCRADADAKAAESDGCGCAGR